LLSWVDPKDLEQIGIANQTTMLKSETEQIGKLFEHTMMRKYGPTQLNQHFQSFNTICTQERQDAMFQLVDENWIDGGDSTSSNTTHTSKKSPLSGVFLHITLIVPSEFA